MLRTALVLAALTGMAGSALAAEGANADGNAGQPRAAFAAAPAAPDRANASGPANYATSEAQGHRHMDSSWLTMNPAAASAMLDSGSGQN
jgi:hypothetical protein